MYKIHMQYAIDFSMKKPIYFVVLPSGNKNLNFMIYSIQNISKGLTCLKFTSFSAIKLVELIDYFRRP